MDTVIGKEGSQKVLLTIIHVESKLMIIRLLSDKTANAVVNEFNNLQTIMGIRAFKKAFKVILTDNGTEFSKPDNLEKDNNLKRRSRIFYCEPNRSDQKGCIEKNHEYIRYILPKGTSFDSLVQNDIDLIASHINSVRRESNEFQKPYDMALPYFGKSILNKLNIKRIDDDDIILKPSLLNKKN